MAGSSHTLTTLRRPYYDGAFIGEHLTAFVGDDTTGAVPTLVLSIPRDVELLEIETNPGATAPTTLYDITLVDADGADVLAGVGTNRSATVTEIAPIVYSGTSLRPVIKDGSYTLTIANQAVNSATGTIAIRWRYAL